MFRKRFINLDRKLFGKNNSMYQPFGYIPVVLCVVCGALLGTRYIVNHALDMEIPFDWEIGRLGGRVLLMILLYNLYTSISRMNTWKTRLVKFIFLSIVCSFGVSVGVVASVIVFVVITLYIIFLAVKIAVSGPALKSGDIELENGTIVRNRKGLFGEDNYEAVNGSGTYDRSGDIFTKRS